MPRSRSPRRSSRPDRLARDRHALYERAVQDPEGELELIERVLRRAGRPARRLREDFSGTALLAAAWVAAGPNRSAVAVDRDRAVHAWARAHRLPALGPASARLRLVRADVRRGPEGPFDAIVALNFSYQVFRTRGALRQYLLAARRALAPGGAVILDVFGGWEAQRALTERRRLRGGATYVWEQESFDPISSRLRCSIHFELAGGRRLRRAFRYDWRLWTIPELGELLREAGFARVEVFWDVAPQGVEPRYLTRSSAESCAGWIAYVVGRREASRRARPLPIPRAAPRRVARHDGDRPGRPHSVAGPEG
jgi:SAM-dependent methyltransferase